MRSLRSVSRKASRKPSRIARDQRPLEARFWDWFSSSASTFITDDAALVAAEKAITRKLKKVHPRLAAQLSFPEEGICQCLITAYWDLGAFPSVDALMAAAPALSGWRFVGLHPRTGAMSITWYDGTSLATEQVWFTVERNGEEWCPVFYVDGLTPFNEDEMFSKVNMLLEGLIGEYTLGIHMPVLGLGYWSGPSMSEDLIPLSELPEYLGLAPTP